MSPVISFRLGTLKGTAKASAVDLLRLNTLRSTKTALLTPKRYDEHPRPFHMGVPLPRVAVYLWARLWQEKKLKMDHKCSPLHFILPELSDCPLRPNYFQIHVLHAFSCLVSREPRYCALIEKSSLAFMKDFSKIFRHRKENAVFFTS